MFPRMLRQLLPPKSRKTPRFSLRRKRRGMPKGYASGASAAEKKAYRARATNRPRMKGYDPAGRLRVTRDDLVAGLRALEIGEGMVLQVHSSLSQLGFVEGGAEKVVDALLEVVGPEGTVMVPTFNHGAADVFDVRTTPSRNGAVTEALRRRPEAYRSIHPTHPYAAIGKHAAALVAGHPEAGTFGRRSPLGKLADLGGSILLLGVGMNRNTAAHIGE